MAAKRGGRLRGLDTRLAIACRALGGGLAALLAMNPMRAASQDAPSPTPTIGVTQLPPPGADAADPGDDFVARTPNLFQSMYEYKTAPGSGSVKGTIRTVTTDLANLRADHTIDLAPQWQLALRADLPFLAKNPINSGNPNGDYLYGVGDADIQAALIHEFDTRLTAGFGARLIAPTGGDVLGTGKWQIMPGAAIKYTLTEISSGSYIEPLVRWAVSFAGDPSTKNISSLQFAPTVHFGLPDGWFFTLYPSPDIRINYGDPVTGQTGRLFLPFDTRIGRKITDNLAISLEVGVPIVKDYPVYDFKTELRINLIY
jgi:hypothetical protein